jgi:decaprenylphospho-beta-D-ribofuranose 2-oxidase
MDIVLSSGTTLTCSQQIHPDLFEATCGGMGLTGIISRIKFRLKKIETSYIRQKQIKAGNLEELIGLFEKYKDYTYSVAWIDCLKKGPHSGRGILMLGEHAGLTDLNENQKTNPLRFPGKKQINFPFNLPSSVLNVVTVRIFNFLFYGKNLKKEINNVTGYESFFYPLDAILNWNRGYGKKGFVQYQFLLPLESKNGLIEILQKIGDRGLGSFLAVLKVFGRQESIISFPREGYTLALDFPVRDGLLQFLDELDQIVLRYGGRIYMSKDARMKPEILWHGYPGLDKFKEIVGKYNPGGRIHSNQSERLFLTTN